MSDRSALIKFYQTNPADRPGGWRAEERAQAKQKG